MMGTIAIDIVALEHPNWVSLSVEVPLLGLPINDIVTVGILNREVAGEVQSNLDDDDDNIFEQDGILGTVVAILTPTIDEVEEGIRACAISLFIGIVLGFIVALYSIWHLLGRKFRQNVQLFFLFAVLLLHILAVALWRQIAFNQGFNQFLVLEAEIGEGHYLLVASIILSIIAFLLQIYERRAKPAVIEAQAI